MLDDPVCEYIIIIRVCFRYADEDIRKAAMSRHDASETRNRASKAVDVS